MNLDTAFFSKALKVAMADRGWNQKRLGEFFGIDPSAINLWIKKGKLPGDERMNKFAELTGLSEDDLMLFKEGIKLERKGRNLNKLTQKGTVLSPDEKLVIQWARNGQFAEIVDYYLQKLKAKQSVDGTPQPQSSRASK